MSVPPGAPLSEDGNYWWDGTQWQLVQSQGQSQAGSPQPSGAQGSSAPAGAQMSDDGNYWWDGTQWQPVDQSSAPSGSAQAPGQSTATGAQINPEEFPSIGRVLYFGADADAYLQDLGIDTSGLQNDDPPSVA